MSDHSVHVTPAKLSKTYATIAQDVDAKTDGPDPHGQCAGRVRIGVGGKLSVVYGNGGTDVIEYASGDVDDIEIAKIVFGADSTAQKVTLYWFDREG